MAQRGLTTIKSQLGSEGGNHNYKNRDFSANLTADFLCVCVF